MSLEKEGILPALQDISSTLWVKTLFGARININFLIPFSFIGYLFVELTKMYC